MESVLFKYADFFEDDGGFDKVKNDFDKLADYLVKRATDLKGVLSSTDIGDLDAFKDAEKDVENLVKAKKKHKEIADEINQIEEQYEKNLRNTASATDDEVKKLIALDKELRKQRGLVKEANFLQKNNIKDKRDLNELRVEAQLKIKKISAEIRKQQKAILDKNKVSKDEQKLIDAKITLQKEEITTLKEVRERISALRTVVQSLDLEKEAEQIRAYNDEIDDLTETLSGNSDKFIQSKINVGNYEESIISALEKTGLLTTGIGGLDGALGSVIGILTLNAEQLDEMEKNANGSTTAIKRFAIAFGRLNKVLKASIIGAVIVAVTALASAFGDTRAGTIRLEKVMLGFKSTLTTVGQVARIIIGGIGEQFVLLFKTVNDAIGKNAGKSVGELLKDFFTGDLVDFESIGTNFISGLENIKKTYNDTVDAIENGSDAVVQGLENIENAFKLEDRIKGLNRELSKLNGELAIQQLIADDSTRSLRDQLDANEKALEKITEISKIEKEIARARLESTNERLKQNIKANAVEANNIDLSLKGKQFAEAILALSKQRGAQLEISNSLIDEQQEAFLALVDAENEGALNADENAKKRREINRDLFEQNLDLLIDVIDTEKNLSEQLVTDTTKNFKRRLDEFNRFLVKFRQNAQLELDEFTKEARNNGLDLEFNIEYDENGDFKVFANDTELSVDNIKDLNEQLQGLGLNEIDINRFREFVVETQNAKRDFIALNKEIVLAGIKVNELKSNFSTTEDEQNAIDGLTKKINELTTASRGKLSKKDREDLLEQLKELEKERTEITEFADEERKLNRIDAIKQELETVEEGSERYFELLQEQADLEKQINDKRLDDSVESLKKANEKKIENMKEFEKTARQIVSLVLDAVVDSQQKQVEETEKRLDKQEQLVDNQRARAEAGLENTLAFEQRELGKREAEKIKQERRLERLEKIKALYASYSNYAGQGEGDGAIVKALRDFAVLEAITASFGDGGVVEDKLPSDGIFRGQSHNGNQGGIPIRVEGKEGIFSVREMENLGKENFYKMKELAGLGKIDSNFFSRQKESFIKVVPLNRNDANLVREMNDVKKAIENKPVQSWDVNKLTNGILETVETVFTKNKVTKNRFRTKKPRL